MKAAPTPCKTRAAIIRGIEGATAQRSGELYRQRPRCRPETRARRQGGPTYGTTDQNKRGQDQQIGALHPLCRSQRTAEHGADRGSARSP